MVTPTDRDQTRDVGYYVQDETETLKVAETFSEKPQKQFAPQIAAYRYRLR